MSQELYQIRPLLPAVDGSLLPQWTRDSLAGAERVARNVARTHLVVGIFAGPNYQEQVRVVFSDEGFDAVSRLAQVIDPHVCEKTAEEIALMNRFVAIGWATFTEPYGESEGYWHPTSKVFGLYLATKYQRNKEKAGNRGA